MIAMVKPLASLSSGLLARKGQARPAMRRQMTLAQAGDELGWNDMGEPEPLPAEPAPVVQEVTEAVAEAAPAAAPELPPVLAEREALAARVATKVKPITPRKTRAAFTLRLDPERHLRLRLAAATQQRSAQQLVTQALDAFLDTLPEVAALARQLETDTDRLGD